MLTGVIDRLENDQAVIKISDGQILNWPIGRLPDGAKAGSAVLIQLLTNAEAEQSRVALAQAVLKELLSPSTTPATE